MEPYAPMNIAKINTRLRLHPCFPPVQHEKFEVRSYHIKGERKLIKGQSVGKGFSVGKIERRQIQSYSNCF